MSCANSADSHDLWLRTHVPTLETLRRMPEHALTVVTLRAKRAPLNCGMASELFGRQGQDAGGTVDDAVTQSAG